ncbi:hypothetical protein [Anaerobranca gottschalkii]|nr:hypothetical protein [Anaerobranca gottschalkii]
MYGLKEHFLKYNTVFDPSCSSGEDFLKVAKEAMLTDVFLLL